MDITRFNVNCSIVFTELDLLDRPAAAKAAGFDAIESWWPFSTPAPGGAEIDRFVEAVGSAGVALRALNFYGGDMSAGERGILSNPARASEFDENLDALSEVASRLDCRVFNCLYGMALPDPVLQHETALGRLTRLERWAGERDATIVLEPLSGIPDYPLRFAADAFRVIGALGGATHVKLLADFYHLGVNGDDVSAVVASVDRIGHVQIADAPGRHEPGTGELPLVRWLDELEAHGYRGAVGLEYQPLEDSVASLEVCKRDVIRQT